MHGSTPVYWEMTGKMYVYTRFQARSGFAICELKLVLVLGYQGPTANPCACFTELHVSPVKAFDFLSFRV